MDLSPRLMEGFQEVHKVLGHLVRLKAGMAINGWTDGFPFLGFWHRRSTNLSVMSNILN